LEQAPELEWASELGLERASELGLALEQAPELGLERASEKKMKLLVAEIQNHS
jgi:hypothetical protein